MTISEMRHVLSYADAARMLFVIMYGDRHVPEFDFGRDDGSIHLNVYMEGKDCLRVKRVIPCENILSARDPVNVVYKTLEDMNELFKPYEEKGKRDLAGKEVLKGEFDDLIDYLSQFDESECVKVKYVRQKIEKAVGEKEITNGSLSTIHDQH